ncbi:MAG TPA: GMC family oxidoreductase [Vicinamibacterales bacterium]|nr:GMC family oxidoreductase [Vicinamibacterales bacterium]
MDRFDIVIIGSGAGGGTMAHALAPTGRRILVIERGDFVPQEDENWSPEAVWRDLRYRTTEQWLDADGTAFPPYMHYNVGGNSKFWGSVLYRLRREDFGELRHRDGISPAWPIDYETLAPYYDRAERLYQVHGATGDDPTEPAHAPYPNLPVPHAPGIARLVEQFRHIGLHPSPLPLGLINPGVAGGCILCRTCNSFPCRLHAKSDADICCVRPALQQPTVTLWTNTFAERLVTDGTGQTIIAADVNKNGQRVRVEAPCFVVSCGAVNSAALLLRSATGAHPNGLANSSGEVGRNYMAHIATMLQGVSWRRNDDGFQKTLAINDFYLRGPDSPYPLGQIQSQGRTDARMAKIVGDTWHYKGLAMRHIPLWAYEAWVSRANDWLVMTEDLPRPDNRVTLTPDGRIQLTYRVTNLASHEQLVTLLRGTLARLGYWSPRVFAHSVGVRNTTHQCGTLRFGTDPRTSVLDPFCRTHDIENLFVVDASFFPSSAAVNPALTIIAQALRVAEHIAETRLGL